MQVGLGDHWKGQGARLGQIPLICVIYVQS
jgi:hypothetical protein